MAKPRRSAARIAVVTVSDVIRWLAHLYPEAVLNLPPGDVLKNPHAIDAG